MIIKCSIRALKQEREHLARKVNTKLTAEERELLYAKWEVPPVGKQRRLQFVNKLWTDPYNMQHVQESAEIVAKLIDFSVSDENSKDMIELNFSSPFNCKIWVILSKHHTDMQKISPLSFAFSTKFGVCNSEHEFFKRLSLSCSLYKS